MPSIVQSLTESLSVRDAQARAGAGMMLELASDKLSADDFATVARAIPDAHALVLSAPGRKPRSADRDGIFDGVAAALVGSRHGSLAELAAGFSSIGLASDQMPHFVTTMVQSLESEGHPRAAQLLREALEN